MQIDDLVDEATPITHKFDLAGRPAEELRSFQYVIDSLDGDKTLRFTLLDTDGIRSRDPVWLSLSAVADEAPQWARVKGIGSAITARARLPMVGELTDDYGLSKAWFAFHVDDGAAREQALITRIDGQDHLSSTRPWRSSRWAGQEGSCTSRLKRPIRTPWAMRRTRAPASITCSASSRRSSCVRCWKPRAAAAAAARDDHSGHDRESQRAGADGIRPRRRGGKTGRCRGWRPRGPGHRAGAPDHPPARRPPPARTIAGPKRWSSQATSRPIRRSARRRRNPQSDAQRGWPLPGHAERALQNAMQRRRNARRGQLVQHHSRGARQ